MLKKGSHLMKIARYIGLVISVCCAVSAMHAQQIEWLEWEEAFERSNQEQKKFVVKIHADFCTWCKKMDKTTYANKDIADYIAKFYYAISLDARQKETIHHNGKAYKFERSIISGGLHQLAKEISGDKLQLPTTVFLNEDGSVIQAIPGYQNPYTFEMIMSYFAEGKNLTTPWKHYTFQYQQRKEQKKMTRNDSSYTRMVSNDE